MYEPDLNQSLDVKNPDVDFDNRFSKVQQDLKQYQEDLSKTKAILEDIQDKSKTQSEVYKAQAKAYEYELYERVEKKIISSSKKHLWGATLLIGFLLTASGYSLIKTTLKDVNTVTTSAEITVTNAKKRVDDVVNAAHEKLGSLEGSFDMLFKDIGKLDTEQDILSQKAANLSEQQNKIQTQFQNVDTQFAVISESWSTIRNDVIAMNKLLKSMDERIDTIVQEASDESFLLNFLVRRVFEFHLPESERQAAVIAIGLHGSKAHKKWDMLFDMWQKRAPDESYEFAEEFALTLLRIDPQRSQNLFLELTSGDYEAYHGTLFSFDTLTSAYGSFQGPFTVEGVHSIRAIVFSDQNKIDVQPVEIFNSKYTQKKKFANDIAWREALNLVIEVLQSNAENIGKYAGRTMLNTFPDQIENELKRAKLQFRETSDEKQKANLRRLVSRLENLLEEKRTMLIMMN